MKPRNLLAVLAVSLTLEPVPAGLAQTAEDRSTGVIEGRVYNVATGTYLNNARVTVTGTTLEVRTNSFGEFRFNAVAAGSVTLQAFVAGYAPRSATANVSAAAPVTVNIGLSLDRQASGAESPVVLDSFVVAAQREMSGSAVAINERRAAANLKSVVAADEFGDTTEGNVGEFVKFIPSVAIDYTSAEPRFISVRGLPSFGTAVMIDGNRMASAAASFSRAAELDQVSLNNMSRIEVTKSPTPDTPADTIGGSVNMVLKSAFERAKPIFNYRVNLNANFNDAQGINFASFRKTPGPAYESTVKIKPGFDLNYIKPVSKNFGYTISVMTANQFTPEAYSTSSWKPVSTTSTLTTPDKPFLSTFRTRDGPKEIYRWSLGATFDWRVRPNDVVSVAGQWNRFDTTVVNYELTFDANGTRTVLPDRYGPTFMETASGAGNVAHAITYQHKIGTGYNLRLTHRHTGRTWNLESGAAYSSSVSEFTGLEDDTVRVVNARLNTVTLHYDDIRESQPRAVSAFATTGAPLDYRSLANYSFVSVTTAPSKQANVTTSAFTNATRQFNGRIPIRIKTGLDGRLESRDFRNPTDTWNFVGPDGVAGTADDRMGLYDLLFTEYAGVPQPFGLGRVERPSNRKAYQLLKTHPEYFQKNDVSSLSSAATQSRYLEEAVTSGYVRLDTSFLNNRLKLTGGVRYEETFDEGYGLLNDIGATYQRDASGRIVRNAAGQPVKLPGDALTLAKLQFRDRGSHAKRHYGDFYPSLNGSLQMTEKLLLRSSYAETITRPQMSNIVPSATASDPTATTGTPTITVNNTALKPWTSRSYDVALEYYFEQPGLISIGAFQKDIRNFFGSVRTPATLELLDQFGLDDSYLGYDVITLSNVGDAKVSGIEFDYRQALTFLPPWASGVSIFANGTSLHLAGASMSDFSGFIRKTTNWGVSLNRPRYTLKANWNLRGRQRLGAVTGANVPAGSYNYRSPRLTLDLNAEWRATKSISLFANLRNVTNVRWREEIYGPDTPAYARGTTAIEYGAQGIFGIKGSF